MYVYGESERDKMKKKIESNKAYSIAGIWQNPMGFKGAVYIFLLLGP